MSKLWLEVKPEIDSAGGFQNLPWNFVVEVVVGVECKVDPCDMSHVTCHVFFQPAIMFSGVSSFLQFLASYVLLFSMDRKFLH